MAVFVDLIWTPIKELDEEVRYAWVGESLYHIPTLIDGYRLKFGKWPANSIDVYKKIDPDQCGAVEQTFRHGDEAPWVLSRSSRYQATYHLIVPPKSGYKDRDVVVNFDLEDAKDGVTCFKAK